jgi:CRISPR/Cas system-associated endoribonuclease Cas2
MGSAVVTTNLTDQDNLKIASVIKDILKEETNAMVTVKFDKSTSERRKEIINQKNQNHDLKISYG